jgi:hypothetical protein
MLAQHARGDPNPRTAHLRSELTKGESPFLHGRPDGFSGFTLVHASQYPILSPDPSLSLWSQYPPRGADRFRTQGVTWSARKLWPRSATRSRLTAESYLPRVSGMAAWAREPFVALTLSTTYMELSSTGALAVARRSRPTYPSQQ